MYEIVKPDSPLKTSSLASTSSSFAAFKAEAIKIIRKKEVTDGPLKGRNYAELYSIVDAVAPELAKHGLSHSWKITKDEKDWIEVTCYVRHELGHSEWVAMGGPPDAGGAKNPIQARASTVTYLEKYTLKAICGVSDRNDDSDGTSPRKDQPELSQKAADWLIVLKDCQDLQSLQDRFNEAFKELSGYDKAQLIKAKDARKKELSQ